MRGKQVPIHDIKGGIRFDQDERRIPNNAFKNLVNVDYNKRGKLVKSKGYDDLASVCDGAVKDVQRILNTSLESVGYLIAEETTRFVSDLTGAPAQNHSFSKARSKFLKSSSDRYFYISDDGTGNVRSLRKWYYSSPYGIDGAAGINPLDIPNLTAYRVANLIRTNQKDTVNNDNTIFITDGRLDITIPIPNILFSKGEEVIDIIFPVKSDTIVTDTTVTITVLTSDGTTLASGDSLFTHLDARITVTLSVSVDIFDNNRDSIIIRVSIDKSSPEQIILHRGLKLLIDGEESDGSTRVDTSTVYTDREPVIGFKLDLTVLAAGDYEYSGAIKNLEGFTGNNGIVRKFTKFDALALYVSMGDIYTLINSRDDKDQVDEVILGRTMIGGGTLYPWKQMAYSKILTYKDQTSTSPWVVGGTETFATPDKILDFVNDSDLNATPLPTDHNTPSTLNPLMNSLFYFRGRAWVLARIADANGVLATYFRWSEVDVYDYWDPLNELYIPDEIIETRALREDMFLAFSRTRTYRITPVGASFEWIKIYDVGIGSLSLSEEIGTQITTQLSCATEKAIYWVQDNGGYKFDGAEVSLLPVTLLNLSLIQEAISNDGIMMVVEKDQAIWLSWNHKILIFDLVAQALSTQLRSHTILSVSMDSSNLYLGYEDGIAQRSADWAENNTPLESTIITKKFASNDLDRIRLYYFGLTYRVKETGILNLSFEFSTGRIVTKTINMTQGNYELATAQVEVYGEGEWFQLTITHDDNEDFEIVDYTIGALPIDLAFSEASQNA